MTEEEESKETEPTYDNVPMTVGIPTLGESLFFETYEKMRDWAAEEADAWTVLQEKKGDVDKVFRPAIDAQCSYFNLIRDNANQAHSNADDGQKKSAREQIFIHLPTLARGQRPTSESAVGQLILDFIDNDPNTAVAVLVWAIGDLSSPIAGVQNVFRFSQSMIEARLAERDPEAISKSIEKSLTKLRHRWAQQFSVTHIDQLGKLDTTKDQNEKFNTLGAQLLRKMKDDSHRHKESMDRIEKTFREGMRLKAPATYWRKKALWCRVRAGVYFVLFAAVAALLVTVVLDLGPARLQAVSDTNGQISLAGAVIITVPALAVFWMMRLISRLFVGNLSDATDALQRSVMVQTYLALVDEENAHVGEEERILILNALFRPASSQDADAPPPNLLELMKEVSSRHQ